MKRLILLVILIIAASSYGKDSWYKCFKGKIGDYPVTMHLNMCGEKVSGYYYYDKFIQPIYISGTIKDDSLRLDAYTVNEGTEIFEGMLDDADFIGIWTTDKDDRLKFKLNEQKDISAMFEYVYVKDEELLIKKLKDKSPLVSYMEGTFWPTTNYPAYIFMRRSICTEKNYPEDLTSIGGTMNESKKKFIAQYKEDNKDLTVKELENMGFTSSYNLEDEDLLTIVYFDKNLFVTSRFGYIYSGGAHGNYGTGFSVYDLKYRDKMRLSDILNEDGITELPKILESNFRKQNDVPQNQTLQQFGLFTDTIPATENFSFTPGGMMFDYVPYEIGPYAAGELKVYVPMSDIEKYLRPRIKELL